MTATPHSAGPLSRCPCCGSDFDSGALEQRDIACPPAQLLEEAHFDLVDFYDAMGIFEECAATGGDPPDISKVNHMLGDWLCATCIPKWVEKIKALESTWLDYTAARRSLEDAVRALVKLVKDEGA